MTDRLWKRIAILCPAAILLSLIAAAAFLIRPPAPIPQQPAPAAAQPPAVEGETAARMQRLLETALHDLSRSRYKPPSVHVLPLEAMRTQNRRAGDCCAAVQLMARMAAPESRALYESAAATCARISTPPLRLKLIRDQLQGRVLPPACQ